MIEISRLNDYFLRYIFGLKGHENILLNFVNSVMEDVILPVHRRVSKYRSSTVNELIQYQIL